jgi:hypothetical protein
MDSGVSNKNKVVEPRIQNGQKKKKSLTAHVIQLSRQTLVLLFQRKIVFASFRQVSDDRLNQRKQR